MIASDGWERGDATLLREQMARLHRQAHRVIWVNPQKGKDGYAPLTAGMQAALPSVDAFLAGHSVATLERLAVETAADRPAPVPSAPRLTRSVAAQARRPPHG